MSWVQLGSDINGTVPGDKSGTSISLSGNGNRIAIGAPEANYTDFNNYRGRVRVFNWNGSSWTQLGQDLNGEGVNDMAGYSVSLNLDGNIVAIGAPYNDGPGAKRGHVRLYNWTGTSWQQLGSDIDGEANWDESGWSVSLSADGYTVAIGAEYNDGNGIDSGHVRVYSWNGISWTKIGQDIDGVAAGHLSGSSVSLSANGSRVAIGGLDNSNIRVFDLIGNIWTQVGSSINVGANDNRRYKISLSDDGTRLAIGAEYADSNGIDDGRVRVYSLIGNTWTQLGQNIIGEAQGDYSGTSLSLSENGNRIAIGASYNDGNGTTSGHVRVYDLSGNTWVLVGLDINGEAPNDLSGFSVSLSNDGTRVAIGAPFNDGGGDNSGHVRIYEFRPSLSNFFVIPPKNYGNTLTIVDSSFTLTPPTSNASGSFTYTSSNTSVATISGNIITIVGAGSTVITATQTTVNGIGTITTTLTITQEEIITVPICFPAKTPVETDQGIIDIDKIVPGIHSIRNKPIIGITKNITTDSHLVCIEKNALGKNIPCEKTYISKNHKLYYQEKMVQAKSLVDKVDGVYYSKYKKEILYNVLLDSHDLMRVNNMIVETLHPNNLVAKLFNGKYSADERNQLVLNINYLIKNKKFDKYETLRDSICK